MKDLHFLDELTKHFEELPGVGKKTARRYAYYIVEKMSLEKVKSFSDSLVNTKESVRKCSVCGILTNSDTCDICSDNTREQDIIIVVKDSKDAFAVENIKQYNGVYHILGGLISPLEGIGPDDINIEALEKRCLEQNIKEVILATPLTPNGETTALFLERILAKEGLKITRLGYGLPAGGDIEYADELTLLRSIQNRKTLN